MGPDLIWIKKKLENRPKTKFCVCKIRSWLTACIVNAIVLHKQRSRKSTKPAMCVWRLSLAHTIWPNTNKKQAQSSGGGTGLCRLIKITLRNHEHENIDLLHTMTTLDCPWTYELSSVSARGTSYPWANRGVTSSLWGNSLDFTCLSLPSLKGAGRLWHQDRRQLNHVVERPQRQQTNGGSCTCTWPICLQRPDLLAPHLRAPTHCHLQAPPWPSAGDRLLCTHQQPHWCQKRPIEAFCYSVYSFA